MIAYIALCIIVLWLYATYAVAPYEDYLYGFWAADNDEFCDASDIESMMLFIGEHSRGFMSTTRVCHIVIADDIANQSLELTYSRGWAPLRAGSYTVSANVVTEPQIWPSNVNITVDMPRGLLTVTADGKTYARLYKQHDTTALCATLDEYEHV